MSLFFRLFEERKMRRERKSQSWIVILIIGMIVVIFALGMLLITVTDRKKANDTYAYLETKYVKDKSTDTESGWWYDDVVVDIQALQNINPDVIGWICFDSDELPSYPILYSGDDETYLRTDIYGNQSTAGCIFLEGANNPDINDYHTIIYGHNMRNQSMFGSLKKYKTEAFYEEHPYFTVYTEDMAYRYQIFAFRDVPETHQVYTVGFAPDEIYEDFIEELMQHSYEDTGVNVTPNDKIITLSTCSAKGMRFVLHAVRVDEHVIDATGKI